MTYATLQQLIDRFGEHTLVQATDRGAVATGAIDAGVVDRALADTDAEINGYLAGRYVLPLVETPPLIADKALAIAIYKLHVFAPDPKIKDDYEQAMKALREIASGVIRLPAQGVEPAVTGNSGVRFIDRARPLTPESLTGFI